jgi:hypothetical protein
LPRLQSSAFASSASPPYTPPPRARRPPLASSSPRLPRRPRPALSRRRLHRRRRPRERSNAPLPPRPAPSRPVLIHGGRAAASRGGASERTLASQVPVRPLGGHLRRGDHRVAGQDRSGTASSPGLSPRTIDGFAETKNSRRAARRRLASGRRPLHLPLIRRPALRRAIETAGRSHRPMGARRDDRSQESPDPMPSPQPVRGPEDLRGRRYRRCVEWPGSQSPRLNRLNPRRSPRSA